MIKPSLAILIIMSSSWFMACTIEPTDAVASPLACSVQVATAELHSIHDDLILQDLLRNQQVNNRSVENHIAIRILKRIMVLRAISVDASALKGVPLETLCLLTTDEVRVALAKADDDEMIKIANGYLDAIGPEVGREVSRIQETMLGTGCSLSP